MKTRPRVFVKISLECNFVFWTLAALVVAAPNLRQLPVANSKIISSPANTGENILEGLNTGETYQDVDWRGAPSNSESNNDELAVTSSEFSYTSFDGAARHKVVGKMLDKSSQGSFEQSNAGSGTLPGVDPRKPGSSDLSSSSNPISAQQPISSLDGSSPGSSLPQISSKAVGSGTIGGVSIMEGVETSRTKIVDKDELGDGMRRTLFEIGYALGGVYGGVEAYRGWIRRHDYPRSARSR